VAERDSRAYEELDRLIDEGGTTHGGELAGLLATVGTVRESLAVPAPPAESSRIAAALAAAHRQALRLRLLALSLVVIAALVVVGTLGTGEQSSQPTQGGREAAPGSPGGDPGEGGGGGAAGGRGRQGVPPSPSVDGYSAIRGEVLEVLGSDRPGER